MKIKEKMIPLDTQKLHLLADSISDNKTFGHLIWMIYTAAETGEYDEPAADELPPIARFWYDRFFEDCKKIYEYNSRLEKGES